jgi:predicted ATPase
MITSITLKGKYAQRVGAKCQKTFKIRPGINLLVGPNGSGKSTIFDAIKEAVQGNKRRTPSEEVMIKVSDLITTYFFDFEKQNVRTLGYFLNNSSGMAFQLSSRFQSHGEVNRTLVESMLEDEKVKDGCVMFDEPDQALDHDGVVRLLALLKACKAKQIIAAVHHPFIVLQRDLYVIETRSGFVRDMREHMREVVGRP